MLKRNLNKFSFRTRIYAGFISILVLMSISVVISVVQIKKVTTNTKLLYQHPFFVSNKISDVNTNLSEMRSSMKELIFAKDKNDIEKNIDIVNKDEAIIHTLYDTVSIYFLGDKDQMLLAKKNLSELEKIHDQIFNLMQNGNTKKATQLFYTTDADKNLEIIQVNGDIRKFAFNKAKEIIAHAENAATKDTAYIIGGTLFIMLFGLIIIVIIARSVTQPIQIFIQKAKEILKKDLPFVIEKTSEHELLELAHVELKKLYDNLEKLVDERTEELTYMVNNLKRSNEELEQFAYVASHDLQEPLRMISSYTQLLEKRYKDKLDEDANDFIHYAVDGANRMQKLINDLLDYSRVSMRGKDFVQVDINQVLGHVISNLQYLIIEKSALITHNGLPTVYADESQLIQLFQNLIENAIKFKKEDVLPRIHITCKTENDVCEFMFIDNGIGIDMQFHERIFVIFQRLNSKEQYPGTGIGLAICKRIVERHGGKIWVESNENEGTTFHFTLNKKGENNYFKKIQ